MITSRTNPLIKQVMALRQRKVRAETGLFLVEGIHPVGEAAEAGWDIETILYAPDTLSSKFAQDLVSRVRTKSEPVSSQLMEYLSDKENPQGILAVVRQRKSDINSFAANHIGAAIISPQDPGNVGTILRTLDAVQGDALFLIDGGVDPFHPTSIRASMGAIFWMPIIQSSFVDFVNWSRSHKVHLIGTSAHADMDYRRLRTEPPCIILLGSEQKGLLPEHIRECELTVSLPMKGHASSLNLAVAAGIFLFELRDKTNTSL